MVMNAWRDTNSERANFGLIVRRRGLSLYIGRRLYRVAWGKP